MIINLPSIGSLRTGAIEIIDQNDGYYKQGLSRSFTRDDDKNITTDNMTKLIWQDNTDVNTTKRDWSASKAYCDNLTLGGHSNWVLPSAVDLMGIVRHHYDKDVIMSYGEFKYIAMNHWSNTTHQGNVSRAYVVNFQYAYLRGRDKSDKFYTKCVIRN